jgi:hypothetical protein
VLDRRKVADVPAPRIFGTKEGTTEPLVTGEILPSCSLAACYSRAVELISSKPKQEQASLLDEVRAWPSSLIKGISVYALITATRSAFVGVEQGVSDEILHLLIAAKDQGHHLCITSSINVWAARWLVAEKINPLLLSFNEPPIPLSCVGGVTSLLRTENGELVSEDDLAASLSRYTNWNPSAFGPLLFTDSSCSRMQEGPAGPDERDIDLALVGPAESSDICARAKRMVILCDVLSFDPKTSDLLSRMSNFDPHHWVVQLLCGESFPFRPLRAL